MGQRETELQNHIRALANLPGSGCRLWRNNVGKRLIEGRWITWGLAPGSADLIGLKKVLVTADMVGTEIAQFASLEVKTLTGVAAKDQIAWAEMIRRLGGIAEFVRSEDDAIRALNLKQTRVK